MSIKKIAFFTIIIASLLVINNLVRSIYGLHQKKNLITSAREEIIEEKKKNAELKGKLSQVRQPEFLEEEARNKLFMGKPGEGIVIVPKEVLRASDEARAKPKDTRKNWEKWRDLFF